MPDKSDYGTANTMRERAGESRVKLWFVLSANRLLVTGMLTLIVFISFVSAVVLLPPPFVERVESPETIETMFSTMIMVIVTGTTLVVTIGQLVLTQEIGPLGDQRDRMSKSMDFRDLTEELIGSPSPADPAAFLSALITACADRSRELQQSLRDTDDMSEELAGLSQSVIGNAETVTDQLVGTQFGSFDVLFAALNFNYGWKIFKIEQIRSEHGEQLSDEQHRILNELRTTLSLFGPAREHIKTLYFQWALVDLSRLILYAAIPTVIVAGIMLAIVEAATAPGSTLGIDHIVLLVGAAFAITLIPFFLFVAYVLRILTIAKRTLAIEPLILRESQQ